MTIAVPDASIVNSNVNILINYMKNPNSARTVTGVTITRYSSTDTALETKGGLSVTGFTAGALTASALSTESSVTNYNVVGATGQKLVVSMTPGNPIPADGQLQVEFPYWDYQSTTQMIAADTPSCAGVVSLNALLTCSFVSSSRTLTVSGLSANEISTIFSFSVDNFLNPVTTAAFSGFTLRTLDASGNQIDSGSSASLTVTTPATLTNAAISQSIVSGSIQKTVGELTTMEVQFLSPVPLNTNC